MNASASIGVFDSGLGGLTVLSALRKALPQENFVYLGDTARVPYGGRSAHIIQRYALADAEFLIGHNIKLIIIACNTATAHAEGIIRERYKDLDCLGVIQPGVEALLQQINLTSSASQSLGSVGILATKSTINSNIYRKNILERCQGIKVIQQACPLLVPLIEEGWLDDEITRLTIKKYLAIFKEQEVDALILACTHYPLLKEAIQEEFPNLTLIDSSVETAKLCKKLLEQKGLINSANKKGMVRIYLSDKSEQIPVLERLLGDIDYDSLEEVQLS